MARAEDLVWQPPVLSFKIERHGATALGSTRAEVQKWHVDVSSGNAHCESETYRQLIPRARGLIVRPIACKVCEVVKEGPRSNADLVQKRSSFGLVMMKLQSIVEC